MNFRALTCIIAVTLFVVLAIPVRLAAQENKQEHHRYELVDLGTFGGPTGYLCEGSGGAACGVLNNRGTVVGAAGTSTPDPNYPNTSLWLPADPFIFHAFQWKNGVLTDLGALPGANSSGANWISANGLIAGLSETGVIDPQLGVVEANAVLWKNGEMINLGTLEGGVESFATAVNSRGQVTGNAVNTIPDPFSPFGLQNRGFLWDEEKGMQDLGTLGGPDAAPGLINERGQIAGFSFTNSTPNRVTGLPTLDPFLWENGRMLDLGTLGGTSGFPTDLNDRGQVVGQSNLAGDLTFHPFLWDKRHNPPLTDLGTLGGSYGEARWVNDAGDVIGYAFLTGDRALHGFLWKDGVMTDLGTLQGDPCSLPNGINSKGQVVGGTLDCNSGASLRAFLWENGRMIDLNAFNPPGSSLQQLVFADNINDRGEIDGLGVPPGVPPQDVFAHGHVFVLIPCEGQDDCQGESPTGVTQSSPVPTTAVTQNYPPTLNQSPATLTQSSPTAREIMARIHARMGRRFQVPGLAPGPTN